MAPWFESSKGETRRYLYERCREEWWDEDLRDDEIAWIMEKEKDCTTILMVHPASGGEEKQWHIRQGNIIALAELFHARQSNPALP